MDVTQGLRRAAQIRPAGTATIFRDRRRTWRETEDRVARLAGGLLTLGLSAGGRAAILALNSDRYFEYLLAVPMAGGAVVPINIRLAAPEIQYILEDSGAEVLFIDDRFAPVLDALRGRMGAVREIVHLGDGPPPDGMRAYEDLLGAARLADAIGSDGDLAGIFYTGGTTGQAKGVMLSHRNLVMNAANVVAAFGYDADSVYLHAGPMFHLADGASTLCGHHGGRRARLRPGVRADGFPRHGAAGKSHARSAGADHDQHAGQFPEIFATSTCRASGGSPTAPRRCPMRCCARRWKCCPACASPTPTG